jgi:hypothetical protein
VTHYSDRNASFFIEDPFVGRTLNFTMRSSFVDHVAPFNGDKGARSPEVSVSVAADYLDPPSFVDRVVWTASASLITTAGEMRCSRVLMAMTFWRMTDRPRNYVSAKEIAEDFGISLSTAYEWLGRMPHFREGRVVRVSRSAYEAFKRDRTQPGAESGFTERRVDSLREPIHVARPRIRRPSSDRS